MSLIKMSKFSSGGFIRPLVRRKFNEDGSLGVGGQAALEYAIVFVVFTLVAILLWTRFIKSNQPGSPTPVVEKYVETVEEQIE